MTPFFLPIFSVQNLSFLLLALAFIPIAIIDFRYRLIPDVITYPMMVFGFLFSFLPGGMTPSNALVGFLLGGGGLYLIALLGQWFLKKEGMGGGDIKLMAGVGAMAGPVAVIMTLFIGSWLALLFLLSRKIRGEA